jgi:hypothetical protein
MLPSQFAIKPWTERCSRTTVGALGNYDCNTASCYAAFVQTQNSSLTVQPAIVNAGGMGSELNGARIETNDPASNNASFLLPR